MMEGRDNNSLTYLNLWEFEGGDRKLFWNKSKGHILTDKRRNCLELLAPSPPDMGEARKQVTKMSDAFRVFKVNHSIEPKFLV